MIEIINKNINSTKSNQDQSSVIQKNTLAEINEQTYWKFSQLSDGGIHLIRKINQKKKLSIQDVSGPFWIFGKIKLLSGSFSYKQDEKMISPQSSAWEFVLPPYSLIQGLCEDVTLEGEMIIYDESNISISKIPVAPFAFPLNNSSKRISKNCG